MIVNRTNTFSIDAACSQITKHHQRVCGDTFIYRKIKEEQRAIAVLSDGLGSGIKANVLSTLTATMALNYTTGFRDLQKSAETIMRTLPVCSERKISYATFTIVDIDAPGEVRIINYDNPPPMVIRNGMLLDLPSVTVDGAIGDRRYTVSLTHFKLTFGDRIILFSDGVSQAGMGSARYPLGWSNENIRDVILSHLDRHRDIQARQLSKEIVNQAVAIDCGSAHDDISCAVVHYRPIRELLVITGPPVHPEQDTLLAQTAAAFTGNKIICGGTTAKIIGRELQRAITFNMDEATSPLPPVSHMEGFDLVTEGIITLHAVEKLLRSGVPVETQPPSPARAIVEQMIECDCIHFLTGTRINEAWQDPDLPNDFGLRRTIVSAIMQLLETGYQKETDLTFV